jgi:ubiquinone/menaquinone biosynthesis C-methylase UbiE
VSRGLQRNYSAQPAARAAQYDREGRERKAMKALAVMKDAFGDLSGLSLLDVACSAGGMTLTYASRFARTVGLDIDEPALRHAAARRRPGLDYLLGDGSRLPFADESFDAVACTQVYEHVPDPERMMHEIRRVLRPGGGCYFSATNRLKLVEDHYGPVFGLSLLPKPLAHMTLRMLGRGTYYYETLRTVWSLRRLARGFQIVDYTRRIIDDPERFFATEMIVPGSRAQAAARWVVRHAYWAVPGYVWLLRKPA